MHTYIQVTEQSCALSAAEGRAREQAKLLLLAELEEEMQKTGGETGKVGAQITQASCLYAYIGACVHAHIPGVYLGVILVLEQAVQLHTYIHRYIHT